MTGTSQAPEPPRTLPRIQLLRILRRLCSHRCSDCIALSLFSLPQSSLFCTHSHTHSHTHCRITPATTSGCSPLCFRYCRAARPACGWAPSHSPASSQPSPSNSLSPVVLGAPSFSIDVGAIAPGPLQPSTRVLHQPSSAVRTPDEVDLSSRARRPPTRVGAIRREVKCAAPRDRSSLGCGRCILLVRFTRFGVGRRLADLRGRERDLLTTASLCEALLEQ